MTRGIIVPRIKTAAKTARQQAQDIERRQSKSSDGNCAAAPSPGGIEQRVCWISRMKCRIYHASMESPAGQLIVLQGFGLALGEKHFFIRTASDTAEFEPPSVATARNPLDFRFMPAKPQVWGVAGHFLVAGDEIAPELSPRGIGVGIGCG
ncbi:hypothetical protein Q669_20380 [Labrenzia sp. C1B10]|nr:hypothetical protein Q669_20380 [Labrenzia sp. C1B10]